MACHPWYRLMLTHTSRGEAEVVEEHDIVGGRISWDAGVAEATWVIHLHRIYFSKHVCPCFGLYLV